ncbi:MAG: hypothetical protein DIU78_017050, partial [Pseudomonadota bacterium]
MRNPVVLHVVRPYPDENSFLAAEAWTIDVLGMVLIDQRALEPETPVVFDVALANGTKVIRAEARAEHAVPPSPGRPGGLRVRFRRYGSQTKAFIDRAVAFERSGEPPSSRRFGGAPAAASALAPAATPSVRPVSRPPPLPITRSQPPPLPVRSGSQRPPPLPARDAAGPSSLPPSPPPIGERARSVR